MAARVSRLDGDRVEILFGKTKSPDEGRGAALVARAEITEDFELVLDEAGQIEGVQAEQRDYIQFLKDEKVSPKAIDNLRRALDDSKRAVRARMRGR